MTEIVSRTRLARALCMAIALVARSSALFRPIVARTPLRMSSASAVAAERASGTALNHLNFDNRALRELPVDKETENFVRQVKNACWAKVTPTPIQNPRMVAFSSDCMTLLDIDSEGIESEEAVRYFSGNTLLTGSETAAHCYCGHQFGSFAGQLGDGAAIYLGEVVNRAGERWELQLKGAGLTPFSRTADGRKVLRSSLREFLCSEAMHYLGVPTTRAGTVVTSDSRVARDIFYDGRVTHERCSVVSRVAQTFLRFGSFEIFKPRDPGAIGGRAGPSAGNEALRRTMLDYVVRNFYPEAATRAAEDGNGGGGSGGEAAGSDAGSGSAVGLGAAAYLEMYREVVARTAALVASWQCVGWTHGVLNTDNMSIVGLTIDYGPFGWMDAFDPDFVPNGSDHGGRYSYRQQPAICKWNLRKLAEALAPALPLASALETLEADYDDAYRAAYEAGMRRKLGLATAQAGDAALFAALSEVMEATAVDFTSLFRVLAERDLAVAAGAGEGNEAAAEAAEGKEGGDGVSGGGVIGGGVNGSDDAVIGEVATRLAGLCAAPSVLGKALRRRLRISRPSVPPEQLQALWAMAQEDPEALAAKWNAPAAAIVEELRGEMEKLVTSAAIARRVVAVEDMAGAEKRAMDAGKWRFWLRDYAARLAAEPPILHAERKAAMDAANPAFVLRNWIAQEAIDAAEKGDYGVARRVLRLLKRPFEGPAPPRSAAEAAAAGTARKDGGGEVCSIDARWYGPAPDFAADLVCTCSS